MGKVKDISGMIFGQLTVLNYHELVKQLNGSRKAYWDCKCSCGKRLMVKGNAMLSGNTKSCGHLKGELHGDSSSRMYNIWCKMRARCLNTSNNRFNHYGGRGISISKKWTKYSDFKDWALSNGYNKLLSIERINNNGNHTPSNCRWATQAEQVRNQRRSLILTHMGESMCAADWANKLGIPGSTIYSRLRKGWSTERALTAFKPYST